MSASPYIQTTMCFNIINLIAPNLTWCAPKRCRALEVGRLYQHVTGFFIDVVSQIMPFRGACTNFGWSSVRPISDYKCAVPLYPHPILHLQPPTENPFIPECNYKFIYNFSDRLFKLLSLINIVHYIEQFVKRLSALSLTWNIYSRSFLLTYLVCSVGNDPTTFRLRGGYSAS